MFPSLKIARPFGINVFLHWTFWLLPLWVIFTWDDSGIFSLAFNLLLIACLFGCVVLHELGHALTARHFGIGTRNITLSPLGGIASLERMSRNPWEEFCIAIAGPLVNVVIAALLGVLLLGGVALDPPLAATLIGRFLITLLVLNIVMVLFNLLPVFPMDGGRVLRAILANSMGLLQGTRVAVTVGTVVGGLMAIAGAVLFFLGQSPVLFFIAVFVIWAGYQELGALEAQERERLEEEDSLFVQPVQSHAAVWIWDPAIRAWVRRSMSDSGRYV